MKALILLVAVVGGFFLIGPPSGAQPLNDPAAGYWAVIAAYFFLTDTST